MERKENDLMLNIVANPDFTLADFASVGLSIDNTSLQSMEQYKSHPLIQEKFSDEYGNFNNHAFTQAYNQALVGYQQLADDSYDKEFSNFISFHRDNIFVSPERRREGPDFIQIEAPNPDKITSSLIKLGELGERTKSESELAQSELVLLNPKEVEQGAEAIWGDAPEDNFLGYFDDTLVLAQYDEDVINEETGEIEHKKGERKIGPNGTYYYEKLDGRDVYGRQVLNKMDVFTKEGSWANQYDFFDSDDINQKSAFGSTMKNLALVGSMFIPYVGPWVAGISLATQLTGLMGTLGKISSLGDVEFMNELEGWSKSVSRSGSTSEYAQNNMWCVENFINLFGDVAGQLKEQRFIFEKIPAIFKGKSIGTKAQQEKLLKSFNDKRLKEADAKIDAIKDSAKKLEYGPALRVEASLKAQADLDSFVKGYNKIGEILSKGYMTTLVTADTYNEAINAGATQAEAVLLTLGYAAGEYALLSSPLGEWILPELKTNAIRNKAIAKALTRVDDEVEKITKFSKGALKRADGETKRQYAKRLIKIGKQAAEEAHHAYATTGKAFGKGLAKATVGGAAAEAGEEVSEELLADVAKGFYNTYQWLTGGESRMSAFGFQWDEGVRTWDGKQVFDRYTMSLLGGGVGGGFANIGNNYRISKDYANMSSTRAMQELVYIGRNEGFKQFRKDLDKAIVGNKYKSANYIESNGLYINPPGTKKDNQDAFVKGVFNKQLDFIEELLNANGAKSDEDFLDVQTLKDLRFHQLQNSVTAGRYLQEYNSLMSKIGHTVDTINKIKSASTDVNDNQTIEDAESRTSGLTQTQEIQVKALEEELKGYQEALKDLNEGKRADEFISDAMFEMNTYLQQTLDFITLPTFVKKKYGKSIQDLDDNELNEAREEFKQFKIDNYDEIASASKIFRDVIQQTSDVIKNSENVYGQEQTKKLVGKLNTLFTTFGLNIGNKETDDIFEEAKSLVNNPALVQIAANSESSGELLSFISDLVYEAKQAGGINPEVKQLLFQPLNILRGHYVQLSDDYFAREPMATMDPYEGYMIEINTISNELRSLGNTPIYDSLNDFIISLDKDPINITELVTKLNTELQSKSESITEFNIQNLEFEVESALKSIQLYKAAIMAARTDASNLNNLYGYNVTLNEVSRKIAERDGKKFDESLQLAQIDSKYADMIIQDLEIVENKIRFAYQIHSLNQGQKLSKQDRVSVNFSRLVFSKAKHLITVPDDHPIKKWEGYLEFESAIKAQSKLVEIDSTNDITLNEETKTQIERERFAVEDAMFDFFNKNTDKLKDPEELSKLIGVFDLFTESNELLTDDLGELDGPSFIWYLSGRAAIKSSAFYSELKTVLGDDLRIAPIATQELAVFNNYANIMNGDVFEAFFNAYRLNVRKKWNTLDIDSRKKILKEFEVDEKFADDKYKQWVFNFIPTVKYKNIVLTEGIPGSGKTVAVLDLTKRLLEKNHPEILANTMVLHGADKAGKAEGATRVLNALGVNGTAHDRESGMKVICPTYKPTNISQKGQVIPESEYTFNADKEIVSNLQVSKTDPPSLIVIDEVTNFSDLELGLIDKYAQTHGITVLVVGDYDQIGVTGTQVIKMSGKKENINSASERNNFIRTPKLGVSMRTDNTLKARNQAIVQTILRNKEYQPVTLWYEENENGLFGDKVVYNSDINLVLKEIDKLLETLSDEKIGFIYTDPKSPLYQKLSTDLKYKDKFDFKQDGTAQGSEGQYYIIDTNSATTSTDKVDLEWKQQVYTGLSRASQGSLIITYNPDILNSIPSKQTDSSLSKRSIEAYLINRKKRLDEIITVDEKVTKVERKKLGVTTPTPAPAPAPAPAPTPSTPEPEPGTIPTPEPEPELKSLPEPGPDVTIHVSPAMGPGVSVEPEPAPKLDPVDSEIKEEPKTDPSSAPINGPSLPENEVVQLSLDFGIDESPENNFNPDSQPEDEINPTVFQNNEHEQLILEMSADDVLENSATVQENNNNKVHIDALCYSFNTFELGVTYDSAGNITSDPNYMAQRIDSINGLIKVDQITGDTSMTTKDDYILRLGRLRSILLNEGDPHKLCEKLSDELGIQGININFAIKNSPIPTDGSQKAGQEYFYKPNPYALGASEKLLYVNSLGSRSDKVPPRKIVARIGTSEHGEFLEIPLITLPSPFTLAFLQDGNGTDLFPELKNILLNHRGPDGNYVVDKYTILSEMLEESKKHSKYQEMTDLLTLYTFSYGAIFRIPKPKGSDQIWTLAKDMVNKGQQIVIEAGKNYDPDAELTTDYNALSPNEWIPVSTFSSDPSRSMTSKIYKSKTGMFGEDIKLCNPGHCFILISGDPDLYNDKLKIEQYIKQKTGESTENKVSLYYVLPPTLTIEEYITDLETLLYKPKAKSKSSATHNLHTSYNVLSVLTKSQKFRDVFEAQMPGLLEKIDPLIQRLDELKGNSHAQAEILETKTSWGSKEVPLNTLFNHVLTSFAYNKTSPSQLFNNKGYELDQDLIDLMQEVFDEQGYQLYHNVEIDYDAEPIGPFTPAFQEKDYMFNGKPFLIHGKIDPYVFQGDISNFVHSATLKMKTATKDGHIYQYSLDKPYKPKNTNTESESESDVIVESYWYKEYNKLKAKLTDRFPGWELADVDVNFSSENYHTMLNNLCDAINISGNSVLAMVVENDILISSPNPIFKDSKSITLPEEIRVGDNFDIEIFQDGKYNYYNVTVNEGSLDIAIVPEQESTPDTKTVEPSDPFIPLKITPSNPKDKKAKDKGNMCNKFIGFAEGITDSATYKYGVQAGSQANTGKYDSSDVIFVSILGKRGNKEVREQQQKLTINEAIKAIEAGATIITDSKEYTFDPSNTYNSGEKLLFNELLKRGYIYQTITAGGSKVGQWKKYDPSAPLVIASDPNVETETQIQPEVQVESPVDLTEQAKLVFTRHPELSSVGTIEEYIEYLNSIFPESVDHNIQADLERFNNWKHQRAALTIAPTSATATKAKEIGGIDTLRHLDENGMHFGNPFSHANYGGVQMVVGSVKEAVIAYEQWLRGDAYQEIEPERRQWILEQIRTGVLKGKPLVYYTEIIPDDSYGTDKYNAETAPNHAHILQKLIYDEDFILKLEFLNDQELSQTLGDEEIAREEIASVIQTVDKGISFSEALKGVESVFTPEEIALIQSGLNGDKLKVKSVSRQTDPAFFSKEIIKMLEENSKLPLDHPDRINVIEIWSKHDGEPIQDILQACKKYKVAPMVSFSITGLGDTALEKGVLKYQDLIPLIGQLIEQGDLNPLTTTIRIDPILVGETDMADIANIVEMCKELGIKKFVTSLVQSYGSMVGRFSHRIYDTPTKYHDEYRYDLVVQEDGTITDVDGNPMPGWYSNDRYVIKGIDEALSSAGRTYDWEYYYGTKIHNGRKIINFIPKKEHIEEIGKVLIELNQDPEIEIETCSFHIKGLKPSACLDPLIIERITGISVKNTDGTYQRDTSRPDCMCYGAHSDMFRVNEKKCFSSCAYCYAGHSNDNNFRYYNLDGTLIDHSLSRVRKNELDSTQQVENKKELPLQVSEANFENYKSIVKNSILTIPGLKSMRALKVLFEANSFNEFMRQIEENEIRPDVKGNRLNSLKSLLDSTEIDEGTKQIVKELIEFEQMLLDSDTNPDRCQLTTKIKMQ